ncbi:hypothetical protein M408DRAFT_325467 [Serendipita vermifera MAFF 305830]|uniref:Uncharacterized protein n=1 Tax=Serendipita vermifera MAFF 305830 TaxID=933852 RepID=A0A0C3BAQ2_SERVB|nr:hypothetical protein M408DRAFT_325467 [Serendipita vermifera MAFF 305830]
MSSFFQPPRGSSGSRTIYTVLHERAQYRNEDSIKQQQNNVMHSPTPSTSSFSQSSGSSCASSPIQSQKFATLEPCGDEPNSMNDFMDFDATDASQLDAFVPADLRRAIDAARYSSLGDFGTEICWEALPPIFGLPKSKRSPPPFTGYIDDVPLLSELSEEQQRIVLQYLCDYRNCVASIDDAYRVAAKANLPASFVVYYLCLI